MLYFYVRGALSDRSALKSLDYLHFLPSLISFISIFPYYFESFDKKLEIAQMVFQNPALHKTINISWLYPSSMNLFLRAIFVLFYILLCLAQIIQYSLKAKRKNVPSEQKKWSQIWLYSIVIIAGLTSFSYFIITKNYFFSNHSKIEINSYSINNFAALSYSLIPITMLIFPQLLYGIPVNRKKVIIEVENNYIPKETLKLISKKSEDPFANVAKTIIEYLEKEKPFVNPDFSIDDLSKSLDIQKHHIYYCFNNILQIKFTTLRTRMRIDYAKEILLTGELSSMSMEGIWSKAGFSSRTNFFVSFKEETGLTPVEYIKNQGLGDLSEN
jgi:AraC-like DNA-binding protein